MTLIELLVAMLVLLVGVWTVAQGFPSLMRSVALEQERTQAARLAEQRLASLHRNSAGLPMAITAPPAVAATITLDSRPADPDDPNSPDNSPNSRDDVYLVIGEKLRVPAPQPASSYALAVVSQGLMEQDFSLVDVWVVEDLQPLSFDPGAAAPDGFFYIHGAGEVVIPPGYDGVLVDYVWLDNTGETHWVHGERLMGSATRLAVQATNNPGFFCVVPRRGRAAGVRQLAEVPGNTPSPGQVAMAQFGVGFIFNAAEAGKTVMADYALRLVGGKRDLYMLEEQVVGSDSCTPDPSDPAYCFATVQLAWPGLDYLLVAPDPQTRVVAVDLATPNLYWEGSGVEPLDAEATRTGRIRLHLPLSAVGHPFRFYYRTDNQACVHVYKPPSAYMDNMTALSYPTPGDLAWCTYTPVPGGPGNAYTVLLFSIGNIGVTVAVDYVYAADENGDGTPEMHPVVGELHTLTSDGAGNAACALDKPGVVEVRAVRGVSVKIRPWWRTPSGRLARYDLDSILAPLGAL